MTKLFTILFILISVNAFAESTVIINPGSQVTVNAGQSLIVKCSGDMPATSKDCTVTVGGSGKPDQYGTICDQGGSKYCATFYKFGVVIDNAIYGSPDSAALWCEDQLNKN